MSYVFRSRLGVQLYQLLPEVYRTRDKTAGKTGSPSGSEDLAKYLDAHGHLLDLIHANLEQQLKDALPESSQDWLSSYFAQLLAANPISPDPEGRHAEVANAVSWRQRKGTLTCVEEIAEAVGQMEVEFQEGWQRVAVTPRIGMPIMPVEIWDDTLALDMSVPSEANRHPTLPVAMVDLRRYSRAVEALPTNPATKLSSFAGIGQTWRQANRHGVPCFPGSFDDFSRRTVDIRTAEVSRGHYHHKNLLVYTPPPAGLFPLDPVQLTWADREDSRYDHLIEEKEVNGVWLIRNQTDRVVEITDELVLSPARPYRVEGLNFNTKLSVEDGGTLELQGVEAKEVQVDTFATDDPVLTASDCLFGELSVGSGTASLDSCTVLDTAYLSDIDAADCIFMEMSGTGITGVIQYSRVPDSAPISVEKITVAHCHSDQPVFFEAQGALAARAVLAPSTPESIYAGAGDGGEMGYFHHGRRNGPVRIVGDLVLSLPVASGYPLEGVAFEGEVKVAAGTLELVCSAAQSLKVESAFLKDANALVVPVVSARDCLFDDLEVTKGLARLEYCTVMKVADCKFLQASDCIFSGLISGVKKQNTASGAASFESCLRYSCVPSEFLEGIKAKPEGNTDKKLARALRLIDSEGELLLGTNTLEAPVSIKFDYCIEGVHERRASAFGEPGYGVLSPLTPDAIRFGAEDGGEMGACHHKYYSLKAAAMLEKMGEFLPVGIEPVLIYDGRLLHLPPEVKI